MVMVKFKIGQTYIFGNSRILITDTKGIRIYYKYVQKNNLDATIWSQRYTQWPFAPLKLEIDVDGYD